jgi:hypothetical protein
MDDGKMKSKQYTVKMESSTLHAFSLGNEGKMERRGKDGEEPVQSRRNRKVSARFFSWG